MRKVRQKTSGFSPRKRKEFRDALRKWIEIDYSVTLDQAFNSKRDPTIRPKTFIKWFRPTIIRSKETLEEIFVRHEIYPGEILEILAIHSLEDPLYPPSLKSKLRSRQLTEKDLKLLKRAAEILREWEAVLPTLFLEAAESMTEDYRLSEEVTNAAKEIAKLGATAAHRPRETNRIRCAKILAMKFKKQTGRPCYRYVGELDWAVFGQIQKPPYTFKDHGRRLAQENLEDGEPESTAPLVAIKR